MTILAVSPHPDDVEIGCFGTLARLAKTEPVVIVVMTNGAVRGSAEDRAREAEESAGLIGAQVEFLGYPDGSLVQSAETVGRVREVLQRHGATTVFAPFSDDSLLDHTATNGVVIASAAHARDVHLYETPSTVHFRPDVFYEVSATLSTKLEALARFRTQVDRPYLDPSLVEAQARYYALRLHQKGRAFEAFALYRSVR